MDKTDKSGPRVKRMKQAPLITRRTRHHLNVKYYTQFTNPNHYLRLQAIHWAAPLHLARPPPPLRCTIHPYAYHLRATSRTTLLIHIKNGKPLLSRLGMFQTKRWPSQIMDRTQTDRDLIRFPLIHKRRVHVLPRQSYRGQCQRLGAPPCPRHQPVAALHQ